MADMESINPRGPERDNIWGCILIILGNIDIKNIDIAIMKFRAPEHEKLFHVQTSLPFLKRSFYS